MSFTITDIENLTQSETSALASEAFTCKGHDCYIVDCGDYFGISVLVFKNGCHLYHANDYQLHHPSIKDNDLLIAYFKDECHHKLFSDEELQGNVKDYDDYKLKSSYLRNILSQAFDHITIFAINPSQEELAEYQRLIDTTYKYYSDVAFARFSSCDYVDYAERTMQHLEDSYETLKNSDDSVFRQMIRKELYNYECGYTGDYSDALSACGLEESDLTSSQALILHEEFHRCMYGN